jgi:Zn-dependent protease
MLGYYSLTSILINAITLVIALTIHEFAHAWTADQLGDDTPRQNGRLTLNPLAHLDPIGSLMMILAGFGWAKPVPVNPYALRRRTPAGMMLVSVAGPFSNLLLAILAAVPFRFGVFQGAAGGGALAYLNVFLQGFIFLNLILLFFNLIPLFPLDGEKVAEYFLPYSAQETLYRLRPYGPMILIGLIVLGRVGGFNLLGTLIGTPANTVFNLLIQR